METIDLGPVKSCKLTKTDTVCCEEIEQQIRNAAYYKWEEAGRPDGYDVDFWLSAEEDILSRRHKVEK